ncbi:MAG TPA: Tol-Pal system beta propeller repeat protein TolB [Stellaceae bacterium]|nr:Tol-Pal system beta propeller repeat protein TolB [Stellaceae bacterium]
MGGPAWAELRIDVTGGTVTPMPIAIPSFATAGGGEAEAGRDIPGIVSADLRNSGLFRLVDPLSAAADPPASPNFAAWRQSGAQALVTGTAGALPDGRVRVEFRLWDVYARQQLAGFGYTTRPQNWRRVAHIIADEVYKRLTGEDGYFDTRIVYIADSGPANRRITRLAIMDQDGANNRYLTDGRALVLTPRFSPSAQEITYLSYAGGTPRVYLYNIDTGQQEVIGDFPGMSFAPRFSPDGNRVVMSRIQRGISNIYVLDLRTHGAPIRLTNGDWIDTSPCYSPDGSKIVFTSDRGGSQQLYVMNADGSGVHRISFGAGRYGDPVWSPHGDMIAFTKIDEGSFYVGVMRPDGSGERLLVKDFLVAEPTWAPNGRVLMFYRQGRTGADGSGGHSHLYTIDLTGYNEHQVPTRGDASDPAWSPLLR